MFQSLFSRVFVILLLCFFVTGCRRLPPVPDDLPQLYPCKITATFGGEAIEGVRISLISTESGYKWKSGGRTDKNGTAEIKTSFAYSGAPKGKFIVAFDKTEESHGDTIEEMTPISLIPVKYRPDQSTEVVEINEGKNEFTLTLDGGKERLPVPKGNNIIK
jgi:hypothetical protein